MFNGSQHYDDEYFRALEPAGATNINGSTNTDRTEYHETVPVTALDLALWLESDRMGYLTEAINQAKLDEQRGVVLNEKRQDENQPYGTVDDRIAADTYPLGHPYSWTTIGSEADLNAAVLPDVKAWFKRYYGPSNAVLTVAGDVEPEDVRARVEKFFGGIPPGDPVPHVRDWPAPLDGDKSASIVDNVPLPRLYLSWNIEGDGRHDAVLLDLFADVLGNGRDSRLSERLVYKDQIAASVAAGVSADEIAGQFQIVATAKPGGDLQAIRRAIDEELERLRRDGPTPEELSRVVTRSLSGTISGLDSVSGKADMLSANQTFHDDPGEYQRELDWMRSATPAQLAAAAQRWLNQGRYSLEVQPRSRLVAGNNSVDRSHLPVPSAAPPLRLPTLVHDQLPNGMKLVLATRPGAPTVEFQMMFDAGRAADAGGKSGTAALALDMLDEGAGDLDALAISRRKSELGAVIGTETARDTSSIGLGALSTRLPQSLDLYATVIRHPRFADTDLARLKQRLLAAIAQEKSQPFGLARRVLSRQLYGASHPYAYAGVGLEADVAAISRDDLVAFDHRWLRPDNATLVIVGDVTLETVKPLLEARFGDWTAPPEPLPVKAIATPAPPTAPRVILIDKPGAEQSLVMAANLAPPAADPQAAAIDTVNTALGGMFVSRLNLNLREDKHWSYGASSVISQARGPQLFLAYANVERAHTADSLAELKKELTGLVGNRPLTPAEIATAKKSLTLSLPGGFATTGEIAGAIEQQVEFGLPDDYWNALVPQIDALTPAELDAAAKRLVKPDTALWLVIGDLAKVEPAVRALKLGEVTVLDGDGVPLR
jgi:zinc protease